MPSKSVAVDAVSSAAWSQEVLARGRAILDEEARALGRKAAALGESFARLVGHILQLEGSVAVTGVGKSGTIGEKISATLSSTGTPSLFLRPVEALHGDLGMLRRSDLLLAISNSGETSEVLAVVAAAKDLGLEVAAFTGGVESTLARESLWVVDTGVEREACPLGLAPTTSTTVTLAVGDALAMVLLEQRGFTREHYARLHPGGSLGQRLRYSVGDIMRRGDLLPAVAETAPLREAVREMSARDNVGVTLVVSEEGRLAGILTDGDLRRILLGRQDLAGGPLDLPVHRFMTRQPRTIEASASAKDALQLMEVHGITSLAVIDPLGRPEGLIHLHDILGRGRIVL
jgi:arabinose-5-phosphate isomerase